ncbi:MAG: helix-turn-helix domain-containing protein [Methylobacter sp.]
MLSNNMDKSEKSAEIINIERREINVDRRTQDRRKQVSIPLPAYVKQTVELYFSQLNGHEPVGLYAMVMSEIEKSLLEATLEHSGYNQTKTAKALGLSRSTLRKKMDQYGIF